MGYQFPHNDRTKMKAFVISALVGLAFAAPTPDVSSHVVNHGHGAVVAHGVHHAHHGVPDAHGFVPVAHPVAHVAHPVAHVAHPVAHAVHHAPVVHHAPAPAYAPAPVPAPVVPAPAPYKPA